MKNLVPIEIIENKIYLIRGHKVMLDRNLAELYGISTSQLKRQVKRNIQRFPIDFMFVLNKDEIDSMVCQFGIPSKSYFGGAKPYAFTEHGILMLSSVLNCERAVQVNIAIMRTFIKLHKILSTHKELASKINDLEKKLEKHNIEINTIFEAIRKLMEPSTQNSKKRIGFKV